MAEETRGGFTKKQWEALMIKLHDPKDPAGKYRPMGGRQNWKGQKVSQTNKTTNKKKKKKKGKNGDSLKIT